MSEENTTQTWTFTTNRSTTWLNVTIDGVEQDDVISVGVSDGVWYHHEMLGSDEADRFSCRQTDEQGFEEYNVCTAAKMHSITAESAGLTVIRGIVSPELPMGGLGSLYADSLEDAQEDSSELIAAHNGTRVWTITLESCDEIHQSEYTPLLEYTSHELEKVEPFKIYPVTEMLWSMAALIGCFMILLVPAFLVYFISQNTTKNERNC